MKVRCIIIITCILWCFSSFSNPKGKFLVYCLEDHSGIKSKQSNPCVFMLYIEGASVRAINCTSESKLSPEKSLIIGTINNLFINGLCNHVYKSKDQSVNRIVTVSKFSMILSSDTSQLVLNLNDSTSYFYSICNEASENLKLNLSNSSGNIRVSPNITSSIITRVRNSDEHVEVLEIGPLVRIGQDVDFWYKVKINEAEGWIFGGLQISKS